jgi:hypothetical protein
MSAEGLQGCSIPVGFMEKGPNSTYTRARANGFAMGQGTISRTVPFVKKPWSFIKNTRGRLVRGEQTKYML